MKCLLPKVVCETHRDVMRELLDVIEAEDDQNNRDAWPDLYELADRIRALLGPSKDNR